MYILRSAIKCTISKIEVGKFGNIFIFSFCLSVTKNIHFFRFCAGEISHEVSLFISAHSLRILCALTAIFAQLVFLPFLLCTIYISSTYFVFIFLWCQDSVRILSWHVTFYIFFENYSIKNIYLVYLYFFCFNSV